MRDAATRIVLVTSGASGLGADVARELASADTHVIVNFRDDAANAERVVADIRTAGGHASTLAGDIADEAATVSMIDSIAARFGRLDAMILNAAGGLELDADPGYAMRRNRDAQRRLALLGMPLMPVGGRIVLVTSHQAHFFPNKAVPKGHVAVAASQRAGETALYALRSEFARAGVQFTVVSGNMSDDTFASAIVNSANTPNPTGIVYVGGAHYLMTA